MRKTKRMIALVVVAMFLLSLAAPAAMAATQEDAFARLKAVSVAVGDTSGDPMYDKNFTRAEAAAIMVNLSGMKAAIDAAKGPTRFPDVPATHWATGVINLAVGAGIIKGYPDGTYKPDANVTYAEMSAMLVAVLGYTPKLQGTWPSNVIGKAAQLGLLDGITVTDYNAPAVRGNVFLASDNALDTNILEEMKDGYQEGGKLMVEKLSVTVKPKGTVTNVPNVSGTKNEVTIDNSVGTLKVLDSVDANPYLGLEVEAWVKDSKVFFFNVKTAASDIIVDKLDADLTDAGTIGTVDAGDTIHLDKLDKEYSFVPNGSGGASNVVAYRNNVANSNATAYDKNDEVKLVLSNGKVKYLIASKYTTKMVEKVSTADEKLTFEVSGTLSLKDMVNTYIKNGNKIALADIKPGNIVDYVSASNTSNYVIVSDSVVEGTLTAAATDAKKLTIDGKAISATGSVYISTNNGDSYNSTALDSGSDFNSYFGQKVKAFKNKDGKIAYLIANQGEETGSIPVMIKYFKRTSGGATDATYMYVAKFDGSETYYEVSKDSKLNGTKVINNSDFLKGTTTSARVATVSDEVYRGDIVKITLTSDNKIDGIREFDSAEVKNAGGAAANFSANKTADTITLGGIAYKVDANTKLLKAKAYSDSATFLAANKSNYVDDVDSLTWASLETVGSQSSGHLGMIAVDGIAKYVVLFSKDVETASNLKYGMYINSSVNADGTFWNMKVDGADFSKEFDGNTTSPSKGTLYKFKLTSSDKIDSDSAVFAMEEGLTGQNYKFFKVKAIDKTNNRIEVKAIDAADKAGIADAQEAGSSFYVDVNDSTKYFDTEDTSAIATLTVDDLNSDDVVQLYDAFDKDGDDQGPAGGPVPSSFSATELIYDFVVRVDK